jgi:protein-disulfide isomerase
VNPADLSSFIVRPNDRVRGEATAAVTAIEYGCYTCPACAILHPILDRLQHQFGTQLRVVFRHFPILDPTERSLHAAEAAEAAGSQGKFWQMHELLLARQAGLDDGDLVEYAIALQLDIPQFLQQMRQDVHVDRIRADLASGIQLGIDRTPAVFINKRHYRAELSFEALCEAIARSIDDRD